MKGGLLENATRLETLDGPLLILAGPGTGKTYTLALRTKYLLEKKNVPKEQITIITFTKDAAFNMRARLSNIKESEVYVPRGEQPKIICTMHSLGNKILKDKTNGSRYYREFKLTKDYKIVSKEMRQVLLGDAAQLVDLPRCEWESAGNCRKRGSCNPTDEEKCIICKKYQEILRACNSIDYDDQIILAVKLLKEHEELRKKWQLYCRYLLVDEYQDINEGQFVFIKTLTEGQEDGLFVVGDDDQSIYSWRYGSVTYVTDFEQHFAPNAKVEKLDKCWRCPPNIYRGALAMIEGLAKRYKQPRQEKVVNKFEHAEKPQKIHEISLPSETTEAEYIARKTKSVIPNHDVLILVPNYRFINLIANQLKKKEIRFDSKVQLNDRKDDKKIRLIPTIKKWLSNERDNLFVRECIQLLADTKDILPTDKCRTQEKIEEREKGLQQISCLWVNVISKRGTLYEALRENATEGTVLHKINKVLDEIRKAADLPNPGEFVKAITSKLKLWKTTERFMSEIEFLKDNLEYYGSGKKRDPVRILTFESAKGLDSDIVFIVGLEEGVTPSAKIDNDEGIAERGRVLYVTMTRAKEDLYLLHSRKRSGAVGFVGNTPGVQEKSHFLNYIPKELIDPLYIQPKNS